MYRRPFQAAHKITCDTISGLPFQSMSKMEQTSFRPRPITSCLSCRQRRVRCDRQQPRCSECQRRECPCEYKDSKAPVLTYVRNNNVAARERLAQSLAPSSSGNIAAAEEEPTQMDSAVFSKTKLADATTTSYAAVDIIEADLDWVTTLRLNSSPSRMPITMLNQDDLDIVLRAIPSREGCQRYLLLFLRNVLPVLPICQATILGYTFSTISTKLPASKFHWWVKIVPSPTLNLRSYSSCFQCALRLQALIHSPSSQTSEAHRFLASTAFIVFLKGIMWCCSGACSTASLGKMFL